MTSPLDATNIVLEYNREVCKMLTNIQSLALNTYEKHGISHAKQAIMLLLSTKKHVIKTSVAVPARRQMPK